MRLSRRHALIGGLALAGAPAGALLADRELGRRHVRGPLAERALAPPRATPIRHFERARSNRRGFGALEFRSGIVLSGDDAGFGGLSGLAMTKAGAQLLAVGDAGEWFSARVEREGRALAGLADLRAAPMVSRQGRAMAASGRYDSEGLTLASDGYAYVSYERVHEIWRYDIARHGLTARAELVPTPQATKKLGSNKSLESIAAAPPGHPLAGMLVTIAERPPKSYARRADSCPAWVVPRPGFAGGFEFALARSEEYDNSDCAFLPSGELLVLERRFQLLDGVRIRLRRVPANAIHPGARIEGELIFEADMRHEIDNMEGLAVHQEKDGATILTMVSDDNFNWFQRNLLIEFRYLG